ncbi:MAG: CotH kinase family protein [bacterium]
MTSPLKAISYLTLLFYIGLFFNIYSQQIKINEFMASNSNTINDPDYHKYSDWIEIYNGSDIDYNLFGHYITDDKLDKQKYKFTSNIIIPANGYGIIWADDNNNGAHTNFKLSADGEFIGLYNSSIEVVDSMSFSSQLQDVSFGRFPDGQNIFYQFNPATPLSINLESSILNRLPDPVFLLESGFYTGTQFLAISSQIPNANIYYTLDGSTPTKHCNLFTDAIILDSTTVVKAVVFKSGYESSKIITKTYLINETTKLPVFSISTNPENFFSDTSGIYVVGTNGILAYCSDEPSNWNQDWERPIVIELFENDKKLAFSADAGIKIFGGCSRTFDQKSLSINFKNEFGIKQLQYRLFPDRNITEYNNFILRNSGEDWPSTMFRDGFLQTLIMQNTNIDCQAFRPAIMFLNGNYWGIHNVREKYNEHYIEEHYQIKEENIDLIEYSVVIKANNGNLTAHNNLMSYFENNVLTDSNNYNYVKSIVDIDEFIDYQILQIYCANPDWPCNNVKLWHTKDNSIKWRWMLFDLDYCFGGNGYGQYYINSLAAATATDSVGYPNPPWSTLFLRKFLENINFRNEFIQRFAVHINNTFETNYVTNIIDSLKALISDEMPRHMNKWTDLLVYINNWDDKVQVVRNFALYRPNYMRNFIRQKFNLENTVNLSLDVNDTNGGKILIHNIDIKNNYIQRLFKNVPVKIKAVARPGYTFVKWEGIYNEHEKEITITLNDNCNLKAVFEPAPLSSKNIVINEINFKSFELFDTGDWIELYNSFDWDVDLSDWEIIDLSGNKFILPQNTKINANDYLVLCQDSVKYKSLYNKHNKFAGDFIFGLSDSEEMITLLNSNDSIVDEVYYNEDNNWVLYSQLSGQTLSLINPLSDNSIADNWKLSKGYGTPGYINDTYTKIKEADNLLSDFYLYQNYPNPFNPTTTISYNLPSTAAVYMELFNVLGERIFYLDMGLQNIGKHDYQINLKDFCSGMYLYSVSVTDFRSRKLNIKYNKMLLLK